MKLPEVSHSPEIGERLQPGQTVVGERGITRRKVPSFHDWRLVPVAAGVWIGAGIGTSGWVSGIWGAIAIGLLTCVVAHRRWPWAAVAGLALMVLCALSGLLAWQRAESELAQLAAQRAIVVAEVKVIAEPQPMPPKPPMPAAGRALVQVQWVEGRGRRTYQQLPAQLRASGDLLDALLGLRVGARYIVEGKLHETRSSDDAVASVTLREVHRMEQAPGLLDTVAARLRAGLRNAVAASPQSQRALVPSLVVGDTGRIGQDMSADFKATGLTHLLAVSGANLALMLGVILAVLRIVGVRGWAVRIAAIGGVALFVIICGPEPSVQRAAAMGLVSVAATGVGTGRRSVRGLCVAVIMLMAIDPWLSRAPGFWLSVSACAGIVLLGPVCIHSMVSWAPRWLAEALAIPLAAQLCTQPIVTALNGEISIVGIVANVAAGPFVGPTTVLGFAAACTCMLPWVSIPLGWLSGWAAQPIIWIAEAGAALPNATVGWAFGPTGIVLMSVACLSLAIVVQPVLRRWWATLLAVALLAGGSVVRPVTPGWPGQWEVTLCDVGQGDATVLRISDDAAVLVDTGKDPEPVLACIDRLGIRTIPVVVLTHFHDDHVGAFAAVAQRFHPELVLTSPLRSPTEAAAAVVRAAGTATVRPSVTGEMFHIGQVSWTTLSAWNPGSSPPASGEGESVIENNASIVAVAQVGNLRVLLPGDAEPDGQREALRQARRRGLDMRVHVLKLPHHGSSKQEPAFFQATSARVAVASAGADNAYGHPAHAALALASINGMTIARTDHDGAVALKLGEQIELRRAGK